MGKFVNIIRWVGNAAWLLVNIIKGATDLKELPDTLSWLGDIFAGLPNWWWVFGVAVLLVSPDLFKAGKWFFRRVKGESAKRIQKKQSDKPYDTTAYRAIQYIRHATKFGANTDPCSDEEIKLVSCVLKLLELVQSGEVEVWASKGDPSEPLTKIPLSILAEGSVLSGSNFCGALDSIIVMSRRGNNKVVYHKPMFSKAILETAFKHILPPEDDRSDVPLKEAIDYIITKTKLGHGKIDEEVFEMMRKHAKQGRIHISGFLHNIRYNNPIETERKYLSEQTLEKCFFVWNDEARRWMVRADERPPSKGFASLDVFVISGKRYYDPIVSMQEIGSVFDDN